MPFYLLPPKQLERPDMNRQVIKLDDVLEIIAEHQREYCEEAHDRGRGLDPCALRLIGALECVKHEIRQAAEN